MLLGTFKAPKKIPLKPHTNNYIAKNKKADKNMLKLLEQKEKKKKRQAINLLYDRSKGICFIFDGYKNQLKIPSNYSHWH